MELFLLQRIAELYSSLGATFKNVRLQRIGSDLWDFVQARKKIGNQENIRQNRLGAPNQTPSVATHFDPQKKTIILVSHDASQTGAPILAFNLLENFAAQYNVISVLLGSGSLENAFKKQSSMTIGPCPGHSTSLHESILDACHKFEPTFALVNSIESREVLVPLFAAGVPTVLLVHEFASYTFRPATTFGQAAKLATQIVFSSQRTWSNAVEFFPLLAGRPAHVIAQGPMRIPREWLRAEAINDEDQRIKAAMRPLGTNDGAIVVIGCGTVHLRKGIDLFLASAAALRQRVPTLHFRFVWVGKGYAPLDDLTYSCYLAEQIKCSGLENAVTFLDEVQAMDMVYSMADIFLLSSRLDPLPNVAIDAMLAGLPLICFENASGIGEILSSHPELQTLVVPYANPDSVAELIERLSIDNSYLKATKSNIRELALSCFSMSHYIAQLGAVAERAVLIKKQEAADFHTVSQSNIFNEDYAVRPGLSMSRDDAIEHFTRERDVWEESPRCPCPGFHPGVYRTWHSELNEPPFVNPFAHFLRNGQPPGPWLLDIISPRQLPSAQILVERVALHLHIHYSDLASEILRALTANQSRPDIFVTVSTEDGRHEVAAAASQLDLNIKSIMIAPNRGRNVGPLLTLLGRQFLEDYDVVGHLHAKRSIALGNPEAGEMWRKFCLENLLGGGYAMMDVILSHFVRNPKLGLVFPADPYICGWTLNRTIAERLLERMDIATNLPSDFFFPVGAMFWARVDALAPLLQLHLDWSDYPPEPLPCDGTMLHAIERLLPFVARARDFEIAGTYVPGVTR